MQTVLTLYFKARIRWKWISKIWRIPHPTSKPLVVETIMWLTQWETCLEQTYLNGFLRGMTKERHIEWYILFLSREFFHWKHMAINVANSKEIRIWIDQYISSIDCNRMWTYQLFSKKNRRLIIFLLMLYLQEKNTLHEIRVLKRISFKVKKTIKIKD